MIDTEPRRKNTPETFGPTPEDIVHYRNLLEKLDRGEPVGFNPRFNAESVSNRLDNAIKGEPGTLGLFTDSEERRTKTLNEVDTLKLAQQRYVAAALGFEVGPTQFDSATANADVIYPNVDSLPERPQKGSDGIFRRSDGTSMSQVQVDAIYAAHFIADHPEKFKQPDAFRKTFERISEGALSGSVSMNLDTFADDKRGARSFLRQAARLMGYEVGDFIKADNSSITRMTVHGTRKGFEGQKTSFFDTFPKN